MRRLPCLFLFVFIAFCAVAPCVGQAAGKIRVVTPETSKETEKGLRKQLEADPANPIILNAIGLELQYRKKSGDAVEMFEKAVVLDPSNSGFFADYALAHAEKVNPYRAVAKATESLNKNPDDGEAMFLRAMGFYNSGKFTAALSDVELFLMADPGFAAGYGLKSEILLRLYSENSKPKPDAQSIAYLGQSTGVLELCQTQCVGVDKSLLLNGIGVRISLASFYKQRGEDESPEVNPGYRRLKILSKPRPGYTDTARKRNVSGAVNLEVFFDADGTIGHVFVKQALGAGLTRSAVEAVRGIKFEPSSQDGKPLTEVKRISYRFSIY